MLRQWASSLVVAGTHGEIVLGSGDFTDHKVLYAKVRMRALGAGTDLLRKPRLCDARAVVEGGCVIEQFRGELAEAPEIPKCVALDTHAELLAKWLRIKSAEFFSIPARCPRKPWIAKPTIALVAQKEPMLRELSVIKGELKRTLVLAEKRDANGHRWEFSLLVSQVACGAASSQCWLSLTQNKKKGQRGFLRLTRQTCLWRLRGQRQDLTSRLCLTLSSALRSESQRTPIRKSRAGG